MFKKLKQLFKKSSKGTYPLHFEKYGFKAVALSEEEAYIVIEPNLINMLSSKIQDSKTTWNNRMEKAKENNYVLTEGFKDIEGLGNVYTYGIMGYKKGLDYLMTNIEHLILDLGGSIPQKPEDEMIGIRIINDRLNFSNFILNHLNKGKTGIANLPKYQWDAIVEMKGLREGVDYKVLS